jgi:hypothetical protein
MSQCVNCGDDNHNGNDICSRCEELIRGQEAYDDYYDQPEPEPPPPEYFRLEGLS